MLKAGSRRVISVRKIRRHRSTFSPRAPQRWWPPTFLAGYKADSNPPLPRNRIPTLEMVVGQREREKERRDRAKKEGERKPVEFGSGHFRRQSSSNPYIPFPRVEKAGFYRARRFTERRKEESFPIMDRQCHCIETYSDEARVKGNLFENRGGGGIIYDRVCRSRWFWLSKRIFEANRDEAPLKFPFRRGEGEVRESAFRFFRGFGVEVFAREG